jgi:hypothetical protein
MPDLEGFTVFEPIVDPRDFLTHAITLILLAFTSLVVFISYEVVHKTRKSRSIVTEFTIASTASVFLGTGALMAMLAFGLYV